MKLPPERPLDIVGIGECMVELWAEEPLGRARELRRAYGGDVLNALVMAARLGSKTGFISKVGDDPFGQALLSAWQREGLDLKYCPKVPGTNGVYFISLLPAGEREFSYRRQGSAASTLTPQELDEAYLASARVLLLSGITQALSPSAQAATHEAASLARAAGVLVAYDPNYRPALWADRAKQEQQGAAQELAQAAFAELLPFVDVLLPSFPADTPLVEATLPNPEALARFCGEQGVKLVAVKAAEQGCYLYHHARSVHVPAEPVASIKDATGAGDAWNAAFLHAILQDVPLEQAARYANRLAAWKLAHRGAVPEARPEGALRLLQKHP